MRRQHLHLGFVALPGSSIPRTVFKKRSSHEPLIAEMKKTT